MARVIEIVEDENEPMICPFCRLGVHGSHSMSPTPGYEGPTPEQGACWGWDTFTDTLCQCAWRPARMN